METARSPHFGLLIKHGLSPSAPGWALLWGVGVAGGALGCSVPSTSPTEQGGVALRGGAEIFTRYSGRGDKLRIQGWMLRKDFTKNRTIWASTSPGEKTALAKSLGMKVLAF